ncbi:Hypothetical predicted protein [Mytilus galloprovincialis]|uniref:Uncharacterized protein n=2 Tax=Mytilus galloprovincialis TaxID=29158 RepID=A0A8B6GIS8_MYTGA|nr:Hypothetical predicted protein [Mytilus galloprovincialis]
MLSLKVLKMTFVFLGARGLILPNITQTQSSSGIVLTDQHYITAIDMIREERAYRIQLENTVVQLRQELMTLTNISKSESRELANSKSEVIYLNRTIVALKNEVYLVKQSNTILESNNKGLNTDYAYLQEQLWKCSNDTKKTTEKLNNWIQSNAAANIHGVTSLQNDMNVMKSKINSLTSITDARGQDFLALLNKTLITTHKLDTVDFRLQNLGLEFKNYTFSHNFTDQQMKQLTKSYTDDAGSYDRALALCNSLVPSDKYVKALKRLCTPNNNCALECRGNDKKSTCVGSVAIGKPIESWSYVYSSWFCSKTRTEADCENRYCCCTKETAK